jgi:hypothetical protein
MNEPGYSPWKKFQEHWLSRRSLIRGAAGTALGAGLFRPKLAHADDEDGDSERAACVGPNPIPGGVMGLAPFGIFIHHNPLNPAKALADINDPSQITDFDGFVGLTHIRGGGMGTDTETGAMTRLAFQVHRHGRPTAPRHVRLCLTRRLYRSGWIGQPVQTDSRLQRAR